MTETLKAMSEEELAAHRVDVLHELERRANLQQIPQQVSQLAAQYRAAGGDTTDLTSALE